LNEGYVPPPAFALRIDAFDHHFRVFSFGLLDFIESENMAKCLKYERSGHPDKLHLLCGEAGRLDDEE